MLQQIDKKYKWIGISFLFVVLTTFNLASSNFINIFFPIKVIEYNKTFIGKKILIKFELAKLNVVNTTKRNEIPIH